MTHHALQAFNTIAFLAKSRKLVLCLDYDGTLTSVSADPGQAFMSPAMRHTMMRLARRLTMLVISGRELANVKAMVGIESIDYVGNHGFEYCGPYGHDYTRFVSDDTVQAVYDCYQSLMDKLGSVRGIGLENKTLTLTVHYARAKHQAAYVQSVVEALAGQWPELALRHGKYVYEIRPNQNWHKGSALNYYLGRLNQPNQALLPIYIGDDLTDEDALMTLKDQLSIRIRVAERPENTWANYYLRNVGEVGHFLHRLTQW